jgi:hypothetical protein
MVTGIFMKKGRSRKGRRCKGGEDRGKIKIKDE